MLGSIIGAGASLLGGLLGRSHQEEQLQIERQRQDTSVQRRVADAKAAGIHPMFALGANVSSPSVSVGGDPLASALNSMGQDLSRAARAGHTNEQRGESEVLQRLALERATLGNELLRSQIASINARTSQGGQVGPPVPPIAADSPTPFPVVENDKAEKRPPLMLLGERWMTNPNTSPMKAWEDQYGDEGPVAWTMPLVILANDMVKNYGPVATWPKSLVSWFAGKIAEDARNEYGNARRWFSTSKPWER